MDGLQDHAVQHQDHPFRLVADRGVMGHDDEREPLLLVQPLHQADDLPGGLRVQVAVRLVREHDVGLVHEGAGDRDPLLLSAAELGRLLHRHVFEADGHERGHRLLPRRLRVDAADEQRELDVAAVIRLHELARDDGPVLDSRGLRRDGHGTRYGQRFRSHDLPLRWVPVRGSPRKYKFWERPSRLHRRKDAARRVTARRPRAASPITNPRRTTAWAPAASPPRTRAATTTACAANPPRNPPRETRKKMPRAANEKADGFSFTRVRTAVATNEAAIGAATGRAKLSIARRDGRARSRMTRNAADMPRPITAKLSMSPRK